MVYETHCVCYINQKNKVKYFDSFGNLNTPVELIKYFSSSQPVLINYNFERNESMKSLKCENLC